MSGWQILGVVTVLVLSVLLMVVGYVVYSGLFSKIIILTGSPPMRNITFAYKFRQGPYKDCGVLFTESSKLGPKLSTIGVFYDDPKKVPGPLCRYAVGSILTEAGSAPCAETQLRYQEAGFRLFSFPEVTHAVCASFPHRTPLSVFLGVQRVYPQLDTYIKKRQLCAHPFLEVYSGQLIHYMSPLARQDGFYVPEVREAELRRAGEQDEEEDEDDGATIVSGTGSYSQCSSVSGRLRPHSQCSSVSAQLRPHSQCSSVSGRQHSHSPCSSVSGRQRSDSQCSSVSARQRSHTPCKSVIGQHHSHSPCKSVIGQQNSHGHRCSLTPCSTPCSLPLEGRGDAAEDRTERTRRSSPSPLKGLDLELKVHARSSCQKELVQERGMATEGEE
ncbi:testis-expressed protein 264 homolog [Clupea harengus]|uniref:Testis-expressed protein 264 homolog n=1 Tax=Clupea harengus TaxID=7950 RepID=A0A6P3VSU8_CLUHA|nr:testis-expressed protein 264 homolog [Clupea harengus]